MCQSDPVESSPSVPPASRRIVSVWTVCLCLTATLTSCIVVVLDYTSRGLFLLVLAYGVAFAAAATDLLTRRIPNTLTYPAIVIGLLMNLASVLLASADLDIVNRWTGVVGPADCLLGFAVCAGVGVAGFALGGLGGGDAKLLGAMGALLGFDSVHPVLFNTVLIAGAIGLINFALRGSLFSRLQVLLGSCMFLVLSKKYVPSGSFSPTQVPFGLALLGGLLLSPFYSAYELIEQGVRWASA